MSHKLLFGLVCVLALGLLGLLVAAPCLYSSSPLLALFAEDETVRQTTVACALGMLVTASVFFRTPPALEESKKRSRSAPPPGAVGA